MFELIEHGGWVMYPLLITSIITLAIIFERSYVVLVRTKTIGRESLAQLFESIENGEMGDAKASLDRNVNSFGPAFLAILGESDESHQEKVAGYYGDELLFGLQRRLSILSAIGNLAPLMGLLGTVLGMIRVFADVSALGLAADASVLASGIWEALLTTAVGMAIAIPALVVYYYLYRRIAEMAHRFQHDAGALIALLNRRVKVKDAP